MKQAGSPIWNDQHQLEVFKAYFRNPYTHPRPDECVVRYNMFNVDPRGNVNFCWMFAEAVGNVRQEYSTEIWCSRMAQTVRGKMRSCRMPCTLNCNRSYTLGGLIELFRFFWARQGF